MIGKRDRQQSEMAISEHELNSMTAELDMLHNETFPSVRKTLDDFSANFANLTAKKSAGRRTFLMGMGGAVMLGTVAACGSSKSKNSSGNSASTTPSDTSSPSSTASGSVYTGDLKVVALAAALENLAVTAYKGALTMAGAGKLGTVPPAVGTFVTTAMKQHVDHASAWNGVLAKANLPTITDAPLSITAGQVAMLNAAKSVPDVAKLALALENAAADTYTFAAANVTDAGGIMTAATIQPVETMHAAILSFVLGEYPVPLSFIGVDKAVPPSAFTK
ncbi:MAG: ferritin-like domain-containing protein [Actinomycetota bacterium]|nr:ferritin-like domain-containing protein [Actinomycetota bacterium]MDQ2956467.1 ferritin-like domain-containing protein [Actinomycetota bacterium]